MAGADIDYTVLSNGIVKLTSLGKDKRVGGSTESADMIGTFQTKKSNGKWEDESAEWAIDPFEPYRERNKVEQGGGEETSLTRRPSPPTFALNNEHTHTKFRHWTTRIQDRA